MVSGARAGFAAATNQTEKRKRSRNRVHRLLLASTALVATGWIVSPASAQTTWTNGNGTDTWFDNGNWTAGTPLVATQALVTSPGTNGSAVLVDQAGGVAARLDIDAGNTVTVTGAGSSLAVVDVISVGQGTAPTSSFNVVAGGTASATRFFLGDGASAGQSIVSGAGSTLTVTTLAAGDFRVGGFGTGFLRVDDGGVVNVNGVGAIQVGSGGFGDGTVQIGNGAGSGTINATSINFATAGSQVVFNQTDTTTLGAQITGTGSVVKNGSGTAVLTGNNSYSGGTAINAGTIRVENNNALGTNTVTMANGATLDYQGGRIIGNDITLTSGVANFSVQAGTARNQGSISGAGGINKTGIGTLELTGNSYTGGTSITGGTIAADSNLALGGAGGGTVTISNGSQLTSINSRTIANDIVVDTAAGGRLSARDAATTLTLSGANFTLNAGATAHFGNSGIASSVAFNSAAGSAGAGSGVAIDGGTLIVGGTGAQNVLSQASAGTTVAAGATLDINGLNTTVASLAGAGTVTNNGGAAATLTAGGNNSTTTFSGGIQDGVSATALTKAGTGTMTLSGTNTYTGDTNINAGVLEAAHATAGTIDALGTGLVNINNGGTLRSTVSGTLPNPYGFNAGTGTFSVATGQTVTTTTAPFFAGGANAHFGSAIDQGTIIVAQGGSTASVAPNATVSIDGGVVRAGNFYLPAATGIVASTTVAANATLDFNDQSGAASITQLLGAGTVLTGVSNATNLTINGGTFSGGIQGAGNLIVGDTFSGTNGTLTLSGTGLNTYGGTTTVTANHTLVGGAAGAFNAASAHTVNGTLDLGGFSQTIGSLAGSGLVTNNGGSAATLITNAAGNASTVFTGNIQDGASAVGLDKEGTGSLTLTGNNTYSGITSLANGTIIVGSNNAIGTGTLAMQANTTLQALSSGLTTGNAINLIGAGPHTFDTAGNALWTLSGVISNTGSLVKAGVGQLTLTGTNTYSGSTTVNNGVLQIGNGATAGSVANTSNFVINAPGALAFNRSDAITVGQVITGNGTLNQNGTGSVNLTGNSGAFAGATNVNAGTLFVNGTLGAAGTTLTVNNGGTLGGAGTIGGNVVVANGGTLAPGNSPGTITIAGNVTLNAGSNSNFELGQANVVGGANNDLVNVGGNLALDGTLNLSNPLGGAIQSGYYTLFNVAGTTAGNFATVTTAAGPAVSAVNVYTTNGGAAGNQVNALVNTGGQLVQFWDGNNQSANGTVNGGAGTWNAANTNWTTADGAINDRWRSNVGVFTNVGGAVTVVGTQQFQGLQFKANGYTIAGAALDMTGDVAPGNTAASFINVDAGITATINSALTSTTNKGLDVNTTGSGTLILGGVNTYAGATTINGGVLALAGAGSIAASSQVNVANPNATFDISGTAAGATITTLNGVANSHVALGAQTLTISNGSTTYAGIIQNAGLTAGTGGGVTISGGTQTLSGVNTYTGATTINAATLALSGAGSVATSSQVNVANAAGVFDISATTAGTSITTLNGVANSHVTLGARTLTVTNGSTNYAGIIQGTGGLTVTGGTQTLSGVNTYTGTTNVTGGTLVNNGTLASTVVNAAAFNNTGTANGGLGNSGTANNSGTINGGVTNTGTFNQTAGATNGGFNNNAGTANISGGAINGAIVNNATFNINGGAVTSDSTFNNALAGSRLLVNTGSYTIAGQLTNSGTNAAGGILVAAGASLTAAGVTNNAGATIVNNGTITDVLNNAGLVTNNGTYNADVNNTGTITNNLTWNGNLLSNTGLVTNAGTWNGNATNDAGGTLTTTGTWNGAVTNAGTVNAQGTITGAIANNGGGVFNITNALAIGNSLTNAAGATLNANLVPGNGGTTAVTNPGALAFTNAGTFNAGLVPGQTGSVTTFTSAGVQTVSNTGRMNVNGQLNFNGAAGSTFTNAATGVISMQNGSVSDNTRVSGTYTGVAGSQIAADINLSDTNVNVAVRKADQLNAGTTTGTSNVAFTPTSAQLVFLANPIPIVTAGAGSTGNFSATGLPTNGLVSYNLLQTSPGNWSVVSNINTGAIAATGTSITAAIASIDAGFHQPASALVASAASQMPDKWTGGPWIRFNAGTSKIDSTGTATLPAAFGLPPQTATSRVRTNFAGFQGGFDSGLLNIANSGLNMHLGVTGGYISANSRELNTNQGGVALNSNVNFDVPFLGIYLVATYGSFFVDGMYRHDWYNMRVTNNLAGVTNSHLTGTANNFNGSLGYHFDMGSWFIEPQGGVSYTRSNFGTLAFNSVNGNLAFNTLESVLGRAGVRIGTAFMATETLALQPFVTLSIWHEFKNNATSLFNQLDPNTNLVAVSVPISASRVGTFGQVGLGVSGQVLQTGFVGFVRGDVRFGENIEGAALVMGLRNTFSAQ